MMQLTELTGNQNFSQTSKELLFRTTSLRHLQGKYAIVNFILSNNKVLNENYLNLF